MTYVLSYKQRVILAALELAEEFNGEKGYDFRCAGKDLILKPWHRTGGKIKVKIYSDHILRISENKILGEDNLIIRELEEKVNEMMLELRDLESELYK